VYETTTGAQQDTQTECSRKPNRWNTCNQLIKRSRTETQREQVRIAVKKALRPVLATIRLSRQAINHSLRRGVRAEPAERGRSAPRSPRHSARDYSNQYPFDKGAFHHIPDRHAVKIDIGLDNERYQAPGA